MGGFSPICLLCTCAFLYTAMRSFPLGDTRPSQHSLCGSVRLTITSPTPLKPDTDTMIALRTQFGRERWMGNCNWSFFFFFSFFFFSLGFWEWDRKGDIRFHEYLEDYGVKRMQGFPRSTTCFPNAAWCLFLLLYLRGFPFGFLGHGWLAGMVQAGVGNGLSMSASMWAGFSCSFSLKCSSSFDFLRLAFSLGGFSWWEVSFSRPLGYPSLRWIALLFSFCLVTEFPWNASLIILLRAEGRSEEYTEGPRNRTENGIDFNAWID